ERFVEREAAVGVVHLEAFDDLGHRDIEPGGDLDRSGSPAELLAQLAGGRADGRVQLLQPPRYPHRPRAVTEPAPQLTRDGGYGEGHEVAAAVGVESVHRVDQAERGGLLEVPSRFAPPGEAPGDLSGERQVLDDQPISERRTGAMAFRERGPVARKGPGGG